MVKNCLMDHTWLLLLLHCMRMEVDSFKSVVADAGAGVWSQWNVLVTDGLQILDPKVNHSTVLFWEETLQDEVWGEGFEAFQDGVLLAEPVLGEGQHTLELGAVQALKASPLPETRVEKVGSS